MADSKPIDVQDLSIGYDAAHKTTITRIISLADKPVSPEGNLVEPVSAINDKTPADVAHRHRYLLVEFVMDGWNYEAFFTQQVQAADENSRAIRQGADNDSIEYLVATVKVLGGTETWTYESGKTVVSGLHLKVSNRKGTKYQPVTARFKVYGDKVVS